MNKFESSFRYILSIAIGASIIGYSLQTIADSGAEIYEKILFKVLLTIFSYVTIFLAVRNWKNSWRFSKLLILVAVLGTILNLSLISTSEAYRSYATGVADGGFNTDSFILGRVKEWVLRMMVLMPIEAIVFSVITCMVNFVLKTISLIFDSRKEQKNMFE